MSVLSLSVEIELGWGQSLLPPNQRFRNLSDRYRSRETEMLRRLVRTCDENEVPITFDVVGHLLLDSCEGTHGGGHEDGWFAMDPGTAVEADPLFYAPDLVERVATAEVDHDIGTHTFSHVPCDEITPNTLEWELTQCGRLHEDTGLPAPTSFVPPEHREPPEDVLRANGIEAIRLPDGTYPSDGSLVTRFLWPFTRDPPAFDPVNSDGILHVYSTHSPSLTAVTLPQGAMQPHPSFRPIPKTIRKRAHRRYLTNALAAVRDGSHVHLWTHLYDLSNDDQWPLVRSFIEEVGTVQRNTDVEVRTLDELSDGTTATSITDD